jgi:hypothetical protein
VKGWGAVILLLGIAILAIDEGGGALADALTSDSGAGSFSF